MTPEENEKHNRRVNRLLRGVNNSELNDEYAGLTEVNSLEQAAELENIKDYGSPLGTDLEFEYKPRPEWFYHVEVMEKGTRIRLFNGFNLKGWQELEQFMADWRQSQQTNDVDMWISTSENRIDLTSKKL
jgi:hypothetical protein